MKIKLDLSEREVEALSLALMVHLQNCEGNDKVPHGHAVRIKSVHRKLKRAIPSTRTIG